MKLEQKTFDPARGWLVQHSNMNGARAQFALVFGDRALLEGRRVLEHLRDAYPDARLILASSAGEISDTSVSDECVAVTAVALEKTRVACAAFTVRSQFESQAAGRKLAARLVAPGLTHVFLVSDGQLVNGTDLARGFNQELPPDVSLTGGLAADGPRFEKTVVGLDGPPNSGQIVALGFYGRHLQVGFGSSGGWSAFGEEHVVTRSDGNILFALDDEPALHVYKKHLGEYAAALPASALRFPLCVLPPDGEACVVRTILSIEDVTHSMVFAGDIPNGSRIRFMRASHDDLVSGAARAAEQARLSGPAELALCVSCVGRRMMLLDRTADEVATVRHVVGPETVLSGFYSYGELAPAASAAGCQLHNQTMTITTLREV